jgi:hypothetical protein
MPLAITPVGAWRFLDWTMRQACIRGCIAAAAVLLLVKASEAGFTNNILITGYWPPTNEMIRHFSPSPDQNPSGWQGEDWEGRGYDIYAYFPEFDNFPMDPIGHGDFEVDYQDTSEDWWRITSDIDPVGIITFSRGDNQASWEIETKQRNLRFWVDDYREPTQPTPTPPDDSVPPRHIRYTSLPVEEIRDAVNEAQLGVNAFIDTNGFGGGFLSEFIAYHGVWYHELHADMSDPFFNVAAGHIHVGGAVTVEQGQQAAEISLRELIHLIDATIPEPSSASLCLVAAALLVARRRTDFNPFV